MLFAAFVHWWYGAGWKFIQRSVHNRMARTLASFSVPTLSRTLFAPWKRIVTAPGAGIDAHFRAAVDNSVSRLVGFSIRLIVLLTAGICLLGVGLAGVVQIALWPLAPFLAIGLCLAGIFKVVV
jgi:hypothetical protein